MTSPARRSVILLSGGLLSAISLAAAVRSTQVQAALHFTTSRRRGEDYRAANKLAQHFGVNLDLTTLPSVVAGDVADGEPGLYALMATMAGFYAQRIGAEEVWTGIAPAVDRRRDTTVETIRRATDLVDAATGARIKIATFKGAQRSSAFRTAAQLDVLDFIIENTHDCDHGARGARHVWGYGCAACDGCSARAHAWAEFETEKGIIL